MIKHLIRGAIVLALLAPQLPANAAVNQTPMKGGAFGIIQCWYIKGGKTKVIWQVITDKDKPAISSIDFTFRTSDNRERKLEYAVIPPTQNYEDEIIFDDIVNDEITVTGSAYGLKLIGVQEYRLRKSLTVKCTKI